MLIFACYGGVQIGFGSGTSSTESRFIGAPTTLTESKNSASTFGFNAGFLYFVRHNLALNANFGLLSFTSNKITNSNAGVDTETKNSTWTVGVNGTIVNIGLKFFLNAPKPAN